MNEKKTISNQLSEINYASRHLGVDPIAIHLAKHVLKTNSREKIYEWVRMFVGKKVTVEIK